jgi:hypothetical protein
MFHRNQNSSHQTWSTYWSINKRHSLMTEGHCGSKGHRCIFCVIYCKINYSYFLEISHRRQKFCRITKNFFWLRYFRLIWLCAPSWRDLGVDLRKKIKIFFEDCKSLKFTDGRFECSSRQVGFRGEPDSWQNRQSHSLNTLRLKLRTCAGNAVCCSGRLAGISIKNLHSCVEVLGKRTLFSLKTFSFTVLRT